MIPHLKLIAFGMATEIIVVIKNEDARPGMSLPVKVRSREAANTGAHYDQVIDLAVGLLNRTPVTLALTCKLVSDLERTRVIAAQASQGGWITACQ